MHLHRAKFYVIAASLIGLGFGLGLSWGWWAVVALLVAAFYGYCFEWDLSFRREPSQVFGLRPEGAAPPKKRYHPRTAAALLGAMVAAYWIWGTGFSSGGVIFAVGCLCAAGLEFLRLGTDPTPMSMSY